MFDILASRKGKEGWYKLERGRRVDINLTKPNGQGSAS